MLNPHSSMDCGTGILACVAGPQRKHAGRNACATLYSPAVVFDSFFDRIVLLGEPHQFEPDGIHPRLPTGLDYVIGHSYSRPALAMIAPLDQHAHVGGSASVRVEDAHLVVRQPDFGDLRIKLRKTFAEAQMQCIKRAVADRGGRMHAILSPQSDRRRSPKSG